MHVVFCTDHVFVRGGDDTFYSAGQFPYSIWQRYLKVFESLTVLGRSRPCAAGASPASLDRSSGPGVSFLPVPNLATVRALLPWRRRRVAAVVAQAIGAADAVVVRLPSETGLLAAGLARHLGRPLAVEAVACPWDQLWNYGTWQAKLWAPVQTWRMRRAVARAPYVLYVSRQFLQRRYPTGGVTVAASNVDIAPADEAVLTHRLERIGHGRRLVLGFIGSLQHRYKGLHTALAALAKLVGENVDFEFRVLGPGDPGPWQAQAGAYALDHRVRFWGTLPSGQPVLDWLDEVDLYLQPSFQEGLPRALVEAMSRGCPAFGSTAGGIPELLEAECLHRPGDHARLAALIGRAAADPDWRAAQARRNFEAAQHYTRECLDTRRTAFWQDFARYATTGTALCTE